MRKGRKRIFIFALVLVMILPMVNIVKTKAAYTIRNNGLGGIYIDINGAPYNDSRWWTYGQPYGQLGCTWFVGARVMQLTGKGTYDTQTGSTWYNSYGAGLGLSTGKTIQAPAVICWSGHVAILEKIVGETAYISEGGNRLYADNAYTTIKTVYVGNVSSLNSGFIGYVYLNDKAPINPSISKNQNWYDIKDTIEITAYAEGSTSYFMSMFKDGNKIISQNVENGKFSISASAYGEGKYSAYFSCSNSMGTVDTKWIDFKVVGVPDYAKVYTSNWWYDLTDEVSISVDTVCAKGQVIGIDKEGVGRIVTQDTSSTYKIPASKLGVGKYSAYFSVYNGSGGIDTKRVTFEIVNAPKPGAIVSSTKNSYSLDDEVEISVLVYCSKEQWIGIEKIGTGRVVTEKANDGKFKIAASELGIGEYLAYFSVSNSSGGYDTNTVRFAIDKKLINPKIFIEKDKYGLKDDIEIAVSVEGGPQYYVAKIYDSLGNEVMNEQFTGHLFNINASQLGKGTYTAKVVCVNYIFSIETQTINFEVTCKHNYNCEILKYATCTNDGLEKYTCLICGDSFSKSIAATGHDYMEQLIEPTETDRGYTLHICKKCGYSYADNYVEAVTNVKPDKPIKPTIKPDTATKNQNNSVKKPKATKIKSLKKAKKALKVKWKKIKGIKGYQLQYSTSKKFIKSKKVYIKKSKITSKMIKKLKSKKKYYVRIRTYRIVKGKKCFSKWSKFKSQKTKS